MRPLSVALYARNGSIRIRLPYLIISIDVSSNFKNMLRQKGLQKNLILMGHAQTRSELFSPRGLKLPRFPFVILLQI
jgi:hypothetical protein